MPRYRLRIPPVEIEANTWTPETDTTTDPVSLEQEAEKDPMGRPRFYGLLHTHDGRQLRVNSGDYVTRKPIFNDQGGFMHFELNVHNPQDFAAKYEPIDAIETNDVRGELTDGARV